MKQKTKIRLAQIVSVLIIFFLLFFLTSRTLNYMTHNNEEDAEETGVLAEKMILVDLWGGLNYFEYNEEKNIYKIRESSNESSLSKIFRVNGKNYLWDSKKKTISKYTEESQSFVSKELTNNTVSVAGYKENIYVCTEGSLLVLSDDLEQIGSVDLDIGGYGKDAHDIVFYEDVAYLLDNIVFPIFVLKVDISDPQNPEILKRLTIEGINQHLSNQWLDTVNNHWVITQNEGTQTGWYQSALFFDLAKDSHKKVNEQMIYSHNTFVVDDLDEEKSGFNILSVTDKTPVWAVVSKANSDGYFLAEIKNQERELSLGNEIFLTDKESINSAFIKNRNGFIYVVYENELIVVDITKDEPDVVLKQFLTNKSQDIMNPSDFVVY